MKARKFLIEFSQSPDCQRFLVRRENLFPQRLHRYQGAGKEPVPQPGKKGHLTGGEKSTLTKKVCKGSVTSKLHEYHSLTHH